MSKKILWLHHFHEFWENGLKKAGTSFEQEMEKVLDYVKHSEIDEIRITMFEQTELSEEHFPLIELCNEKGIVINAGEYGYNWKRVLYEDEEDENTYYKEQDLDVTWCYGTRDHHGDEDVIEILDFHHQMKSNNDMILLGGAFADECLSDAIAVLEALEIDYEEVDELSVGSGVEYEFKGVNPRELKDEIQNEINQIDIEIEEKCQELNIDDDIDNLIESDPNFARNKLQELVSILESNEEEFEEFCFGDISSSYSEFTDIIENYNENQDIDWELEEKINQKIKENLFKKVYNPGENIKTYYHGTTWKIEDEELEMHTDLDRDHSGYGANYVSNEEAVAEWFKSWGMSDDEDGIRVVFKLKIELEKVLEWDISMDRDIYVNDKEYNIIEDREDMYTELNNDYDAIIIKNNYSDQNDGDDIALLLDIPEDKIDSIKIMKSQDEWTEYLSVDDAKDYANKLMKKQKNKNKSTKKIKINI
jgi:hypothetical protein